MSKPGWRSLLLPFVPLYVGVIGAKQWLFDHGLLQQRSLPRPVISIGSLSAGGAGKTPMVLMLGRLLQQRGIDFRILTRGYRRTSTTLERVDSSGDAVRFGDEPLLLARRLAPAAVYAGIDRYRAGMMAEYENRSSEKTIYLLDDGFQHRKLERDIDIVLLTRQELYDRLLPAGNLREPLSMLRHADVIVVREDELEAAEWVAAHIPKGQAAVWIIRRRLQFSAETAMPRRPVVFSGLARPENFAAMLARGGVVASAVVNFRDHHPYSSNDIEALLRTAQENGADGFMTTEKDAVKLDAAMMERLQTIGQVAVPELHVELTDEETKIDKLLSLLAAGGGGHA